MRIYTVFVLVIFFFMACKPKENVSDIRVFHYNQPNKITSLDPAFAKSQNNMWSVHHIFNSLVQLDSELELQPSVAKRWIISDDGLHYTFYLRDDIYFHDNECFTDREDRKLRSKDVVYSFERIISDTLNSPGSWIFNGKVNKELPFEAIDDTTFVLHLDEPFLPMLNILSMQYCSIVSQSAVQFYGNNFRANPVGTGPFKFKRWIENQGLYLIKNEDYFEKLNGTQLPFLDGVRTSFMEDKKIAFLELLNNKVECVNGLESSFINELLTPEGKLQADKKSQLELYKSPYLNFEYLGINMENVSGNEALGNKKVRQALNYAIDRKTMLQSLRNNFGNPANSGVIPMGLPSYDSISVPGYNYDLKKAIVLLAEANFPNGKGIKPIDISTNKDYLDIATFVAKQWEKLGIKVNIKLMESASLREGMRKGSIDMFRASWIADYPDGENFLCLFYSGYSAPPRYTRFSNVEFDILYEKAIRETNLIERTKLYHEMNRIIVEEAPVIFLFYDESALFTTKNIKGVQTNAINLLQVKTIKEL